MTLRPLLDHLDRTPEGKAVLEGGTAVVSSTLRPSRMPTRMHIARAM